MLVISLFLREIACYLIVSERDCLLSHSGGDYGCAQYEDWGGGCFAGGVWEDDPEQDLLRGAKQMNLVLKTRNFVSKNEEFCIENDGFRRGRR